MVVFRLIRAVITPPAVSIPSESGATSSNNKSCTASDLSPERIAACTAAPYATAYNFFYFKIKQLNSKQAK